ncbi:hypothetical protein C0995_016644 [Termitomyces sp. Mi166|nr:hypothetical protein C0995_016644 [Termitomyces sp. Mi166\
MESPGHHSPVIEACLRPPIGHEVRVRALACPSFATSSSASFRRHSDSLLAVVSLHKPVSTRALSLRYPASLRVHTPLPYLP